MLALPKDLRAPTALRRGAIALLLLVAAGCQSPKRRCAEYDQAEARFNELTSRVLDPTFGDPRFEPAAAAFEAVPRDCERYESGLAVARTIRQGQDKRRAEEASTAAAAAAAAAA
ncbi:MAG: hypothetical protein KC933_26080, partial [Myxococcales bacterium]|nr:hypothetical protein [Myxococcales bacterium]